MIRALSKDEFPAAAQLAAAAYREDPAFAHILPDDAARRRRLPSLIEALLRADAANGGRLSGAFDDGALVGVSSVLPYGASAPRARDLLIQGRGLAWLLRDPAAILRALAVFDAVRRVRPASPDSLHLLAVHPATQRRGVGAALVRDALKDGKSVHLETFSAESAAWCEARGFKRLLEVRSTVRPAFWTLRRGEGPAILHP